MARVSLDAEAMSRPRSALRRACCAAALSVLAAWNVGCSVTALSEKERAIAVNRCESDDDCSGGRCSGGLCVAERGELSSLLFEITPTASGESLAGVSFLQSSSDLALAGGSIELMLDAVPIEGRISATPRPSCLPTFTGSELLPLAVDDTVPGRVTFTPSFRAFGLSLAGRTSETQALFVKGGTKPSSYVFRARLPAGDYDVYAEPYPLATELAPEQSCKYPPQLIRGLCIEGRARLALPMPLPTHLKLSLTDRDQRLDDWVVDVIDPATGMVISNKVALSLPSTSGGLSEYSAELDYLPVIEHRDCQQLPPAANELVRLTPPSGVVAPTILFDRTALQLFSSGVGRIDELPGFTKPVVVEGHVFSGATQIPEAATLSFVATSLVGVPAGVLASFVRTAETSAEGHFEVELLPGTYEVQATPDGAGSAETAHSAARMTWEVAASPPRQAGRGIALANAIVVAGAAVVPSRDRRGARGASVVAEASHASGDGTLLSRALDGVQLVPRATTALITDAAGNFALSADAGRFDFFVRPPEGSSFAWLVMPGLDLQTPVETRQLATLGLPLPVVYEVQAIGDSDILPAQLVGARVRVFVPLDEDGRPVSDIAGTSFLPVAEGRLDSLGRAVVMVPASLNPPPSPFP